MNTDNSFVKKYRLLVNLPYCKAGTIYISADGFNVCDKCSYVPDIIGMKHTRFAIHIDWIKDNPHFFEEVLAPPPVKETVEFIEMNIDYCGKPAHSFTTTNNINKFPAIRQAIEYILNNEQLPLHEKTDTVVQDKPEWEILKCRNYVFGVHNFVPVGESPTPCLKEHHPCEIYSVRRLSDNCVFTVGDEVKVNKKDEPTDWWGEITSFWINGMGKMHICYNGHHYHIKHFEKKN